jgi:hypothetical protein
MSEPAAKRQCRDPALEPRSKEQIEKIVAALGKVSGTTAKPVGGITTEPGGEGKLFINGDNGKRFTISFPPGPITMFSGGSKMTLMIQCATTDTTHPHYETLRDLYALIGGGSHADGGIPIGEFWTKHVAPVNSNFMKKVQNLKDLRKLGVADRIEAIKSDFESSDPTRPGLTGKSLFAPSTMMIRQKEGQDPMYTLTINYYWTSKQGDRDETAGVSLTPKMQAHLDANREEAIDDKRKSPFTTPRGTNLPASAVCELPWVVNGDTEFIKLYAAAEIAIPSLNTSAEYGRLTLPAYPNRVSIYGIVSGDGPNEESAASKEVIDEVYATA